MSRLLAALRRIEARSDTVAATVAVDADFKPSTEDDPVVASSSSPQESYGWPGDIVYDPQEYPGYWARQASDWPLVSQEAELPEAETGSADSPPWPDLGFVGTSETPMADERDTDVIEPMGEHAVEAVLTCDPAVEEFPSFAEPLNADQTNIGDALAATGEEPSAAPTVSDEIVTELAAHLTKHIPSVADDLSNPAGSGQPTPSVSETLPSATETLKAGVGNLITSLPSRGEHPAVQVVNQEQPHFSRPTTDETTDEPVVSVRLPGFGRPNRRGRGAEQETVPEGFRRPALVPFLAPQQRPYREACESILSALPQGNSVALVLAWTDEDLDHCVLSARLAEVMADRLDDPVLLIDMGPKRRLSTLLQASAIGSLTEAMVGFVSWRDQIVQTSTAGLCLLPSGPNDFEADPVAVARLIEACKEDFGMVLVLGGALSVVPENVLTACDAAVLLVEAGHTSTVQAAGAIERLRRSGTDVAGCLLTGVAEGT